MSKEEIPCQVFVRVLKKKPGLKETNFQVSEHTGPPHAGLSSRSDGFCTVIHLLLCCWHDLIIQLHYSVDTDTLQL